MPRTIFTKFGTVIPRLGALCGWNLNDVFGGGARERGPASPSSRPAKEALSEQLEA